jgi:hypothetical protein
MRVQFANAANEKAPARHQAFRDEVLRLVAGGQAVCDIGGGPNPLFSSTEAAHLDLSYVLLDISEQQLEKAPPEYSTLLCDVAKPPLEALGSFDLVFSRWVAEHAPSAESFHRGVGSLLKPLGYAVHLFPTLFALPFVANRLLPERLSYQLANARALTPGAARERHGNFGKFPAYYRACYGPTRRQIKRLSALGFSVERYIGFFGHAYYRKLPVVGQLESALASWLVAHPRPALTSSAVVVLRKVS